MKKLGETIKQIYSKSRNDDDLRNLFLWFNSRKGHDEINAFLDTEWTGFEGDDNIHVESQKMIAQIKMRINRSRISVLKQNARQFLPYAAMLAVVLACAWYISSIHKTEVSSPETAITTCTTVITENGQRSRVVLPDRSIVWLNSGTVLSYPNNFSGQNRKVNLQGQAFFQVAHNGNQPFLVQAHGLVVTVLGTRFDVNAFPETGEIAIVLESGKVELTHREFDSFRYTMNPGELAAYNLTGNSVKVSKTNVSVYSSWKDGKLIFRNSSMKDVIEKLRRWYNVNIEVTDPEVYNSIFTGTIQNESYEEIFRLIEIACPVGCIINHNYEKNTKPVIFISRNRK